MQIYLFDDYDSVTDEILAGLIASLPEERRQKALRFRRRNDRISCAAAYLLLGYGLRQSRGILSFTAAENENGKPYLTDHPGVYFNLSHCGCGCICALSGSEAGADIQDIVLPEENTLRCVCSGKELAAVTLSDDPGREFTRIWCMKEAYLKMLGTGITDDLKKTDTSALRNVTVFGYERYFIAAASEGPETVTVIPTDLDGLTEYIP